MGTATRTTGVAQSTAAINCAFCNKRTRCRNVASLKAQAQREDRVVVCGDYYPKALHDAGYREGTPRAQEHAAWMEAPTGSRGAAERGTLEEAN